MSDTPETLAAILAEMRLDADILVFPTLTPDKLRTYADRIEAAAEREREEWRRQLRNEILINDALATTRPQFNYVDDVIAEAAKERAHEIELAKLRAPGNAAAMREALEKFLDFSRRGLAFFTSYRYTEAENAEIEAAFDGAKAALAAPARNCGLYSNWETALPAWAMETGEEVDSKTGFLDNAQLKRFLDWLFAPAKGGEE